MNRLGSIFFATTWLVIFLGLSLQSQAKKRHYPLAIIAGLSALIVTGEIIEVGDKVYTFRVDRTIKGIQQKTIIVNKFQEWTCDTRSKKVLVGQRILLFLKQKSTDYAIINGSSGELIVENNFIDRLVPYSSRITLDEVVSGISAMLECYKFMETEYLHKNNRFLQLKADSDVLQYSRLNAFRTWLFASVTNFDIVKQKS